MTCIYVLWDLVQVHFITKIQINQVFLFGGWGEGFSSFR